MPPMGHVGCPSRRLSSVSSFSSSTISAVSVSACQLGLVPARMVLSACGACHEYGGGGGGGGAKVLEQASHAVLIRPAQPGDCSMQGCTAMAGQHQALGLTDLMAGIGGQGTDVMQDARQALHLGTTGSRHLHSIGSLKP